MNGLGVRSISLSADKVTLVDDDDWHWLAQYNWSASKKHNGEWYAQRRDGRRTVYMHREIALRHGIVTDAQIVDHIDRVTLDNRKANLRRASHAMNRRNSGKTWAASGTRGVHFDKTRQRWLVDIHFEGQVIRKYFGSDKEAAERYATEWYPAKK